jgi:hypothetical protein
VYEVRAHGDRTVDRRAAGPDRGAAHRGLQSPLESRGVERTLLFDTQRGRLQEVEGTPAGTETVTVAGREVAAQKHRIAGDLERELWYDPDDNWLQSRLEHDGTKITLTRRSPSGL